LAWMWGQIRRGEGSARLFLVTETRWYELRPADAVEIWRDGRWRRGVVDYSGLVGWYWTDKRHTVKLLAGDDARVRDVLREPIRPRGGGGSHG